MSNSIPAESPRPESLWLATTPTTEYGPLEDGLTVDAAVVGGGITGLSAALELQDAGRSVVVLEADKIVEGTTGHTTAKLTSQHGLVYDRLVSQFGEGKARQYAAANEAAIETVERRVETLDIDCDFRRTPAYTYAASPDDLGQIRDEVAAAQRVDLPASYVDETPLPFDVPGAVRFDEQAAFHPRKYLLAIAERIHDDGGHVFEETRALEVEPGSPCRVETDHGTVVADDVVVATHFPVLDRAGYFARMHPHRAYLLAVRIDGTPPEGMYYNTASPAATMRTYSVANGGAGAGDDVDDEDGDLLLVGGQSHKPSVDGVPTSERYRRCEAFARERFDVASVEYRWSTMDYSPVDDVPFIGRIDPLSEGVYVGTGFKGWGMTTGTAAETILADLIVEGSSPWADVFDPQRFTPKASAKRFLKENATVGGSFVGDRIKSLLAALGADGAADLPRGDARVVRRASQPVGLYRDDEGTTHAVSATCPHMGCLVRWNDAEHTWDCPCHGSRFSHEGEVLSGPAVEGLLYRQL
ncbi:FAD dependent oxidoreductase [Natrinema pellirubrum DSM 15624]|uniref:FAD dependent oxidoreductase n=1 Tax=Natrinema pellirubrum (strain DSM 15624 / CIP 106293 / JCM 10476 / NCIMB 786 / 157) TaxID=797303 RepID=L0JMZ2_NATP1|nr:FAD-dependent oxidoreductase [Natrinema pellirubrum]AGB31947.1 glycine/D-amino acid oxidase, deaminating [Natrinema pellirubrum DSM 15624]ELY77886.1 FAD dependent oxidoreductase [Natrinema pellirubrum DSM 15624]